MKDKTFNSDTLRLYSMCAVPMLLVLVFNYIPMFGIIIAFKDYKYNLGIFGSKWVGLKNFESFINSGDFYETTRNTILNNTFLMLTSMFAAVILAIILFQVASRNKTKVYQTVLLTPHFISWVVAGYMVYAFLNPSYGIINVFLNKIGLPSVEWYGKPEIWPFILVIVNIWKGVGLNSVIYYATLMGIDESLFEAARIDGANKLQIIRKIMIPELTSIIIVLLILDIGKILKADFGLFYFIPRNIGVLYPTTDVLSTYIFRQMRINSNINVSSAAGLLESVVGFVLVMITNYVVNKIDSDKSLF